MVTPLAVSWVIMTSGQIVFHQPGFPWNKRSNFPYTKPQFGVNRSCEVAMQFDQMIWINLPPFSYHFGYHFPSINLGAMYGSRRPQSWPLPKQLWGSDQDHQESHPSIHLREPRKVMVIWRKNDGPKCMSLPCGRFEPIVRNRVINGGPL